MKKYIKHPAIWVAKNKTRSLMGKKVCLDNIPWYNVGQDPLQGDLNYSRMNGFNDGSGIQKDPEIPLVED